MVSPVTPVSPVVKDAVKTVILALEAYGFRGRSDLTKTERHWQKLANICPSGWIGVAKYKLAAFYAFHIGQILPEKPWKEEEETEKKDKPEFLVGGGAGRWLKAILNGPRKLDILASLKQTKKGMPRPGAKALDAAIENFVTTITTEKGQTLESLLVTNWSEIAELHTKVEHRLSVETVKEQLRRTVRELFTDKKGRPIPMTMEERIKPFFPSTSANYINSRTHMGAVGSILEHPSLLKGLRRPGGWLETRESERLDDSEEENLPTEEYGRYVTIEDKEFKAKFQTLWWRLLKEAATEKPEVEPVALAESLKVRIITKGPPFMQTVLKSLQKVLHKRLRQHKVFQLLGKPVDELVILNGMGRNLHEGEVYISGDYKAATDNLHSWVSETVADELSNCLLLGKPERELFLRSLTGHLIDGKPQKRGQLMGSITSFPILCIANAAICRWAMELAEKKPKMLIDCALLVNGDDCLFRSLKIAYSYWGKISGFSGLEESMGKVSVHERILEVNSTIFRRLEKPFSIPDGDKTRETYIQQVKYVNLGLMTGQKRSGAKVGMQDQADPRNNIGTRARLLINSCPESIQEKVMKIFIKKHKDVLTKMRLPWYLPEWIGGVGLPIGSWGGPSELDLRLAQKVLFNWAKERPISLTHQEAPWKTWMLAGEHLPMPFYVARKDSCTEEYQNTVAKKCVDLLFDSNISLSAMYEATNDSGAKVSRAIKHNAKLYTPGKETLPSPLNPELLQFRGKYATWLAPRGFSESEEMQLLIARAKANKNSKNNKNQIKMEENTAENLQKLGEEQRVLDEWNSYWNRRTNFYELIKQFTID